jgi:amino acid transporter
MADGVDQSQPLVQPHFARRATGFVRDIKVRDAVIFNVLPACPGLVMALSIFWVLSTFTGVNLYVGIGITAVCAFLVSSAFGLMSQIMPRSGADYILISRSIHPALAVGSSILIGTSSMIAMGYWGVFTANICIGPMMTMLGVSTGSHWLQNAGVTVTHHPWNMLIGFGEVAILVAIMMVGTRLMMRVQFWLFLSAMAGFLVAGLTLLFTSHSASSTTTTTTRSRSRTTPTRTTSSCRRLSRAAPRYTRTPTGTTRSSPPARSSHSASGRGSRRTSRGRSGRPALARTGTRCSAVSR